MEKTTENTKKPHSGFSLVPPPPGKSGHSSHATSTWAMRVSPCVLSSRHPRSSMSCSSSAFARSRSATGQASPGSMGPREGWFRGVGPKGGGGGRTKNNAKIFKYDFGPAWIPECCSAAIFPQKSSSLKSKKRNQQQ